MSAPLGILGGVFDPVHSGHLAVATMAKEFFKLETVLFVPSGNPPHKNSVSASSNQRLEMLRIAVNDLPWAQIWDKEITKNGYSYSFDTITELQAVFKKPLYFIVGADNLNEIPAWHRFQELLSMITLCVTRRPGYDETRIPESMKMATFKWFPSPEWGISSSMIRTLLLEGFSCRYLIPDKVVDYIREYQLYGSETITCNEQSKIIK